MHAHHVNNSPRLPRQSPTNREGRRLRFIQRIEHAPDAPGRWALFVAQIAQLVDDEDQLDRLFESVLDAPPERIALFAAIAGGR
jgi:hypothetical protein